MNDNPVSTRCISDAEFAKYFIPPMTDVTDSADQILDICPYVEAIPAAEIGDLAVRNVEYVYRDPNAHY